MALATDFQNSLQDFINWLTLAEQSLNIAPPPSLILAAVLAQIDEHKVPKGSIPGTEGPRGGSSTPLWLLEVTSISSDTWGTLCCWQVFANEVNAHRDRIIELDQTGNQLKFLSQKQDVVLIKNLLVSVQSRWEKVVQRSVERGRALDDARKRAKQVRGMGRVGQAPRNGQYEVPGPQRDWGHNQCEVSGWLMLPCSSMKPGRS